MATKEQIERMLLHSKNKLAEWTIKLNKSYEYSKELNIAENKVYQYKYEVINLKKALAKK